MFWEVHVDRFDDGERKREYRGFKYFRLGNGATFVLRLALFQGLLLDR